MVTSTVVTKTRQAVRTQVTKGFKIYQHQEDFVYVAELCGTDLKRVKHITTSSTSYQTSAASLVLDFNNSATRGRMAAYPRAELLVKIRHQFRDAATRGSIVRRLVVPPSRRARCRCARVSITRVTATPSLTSSPHSVSSRHHTPSTHSVAPILDHSLSSPFDSRHSNEDSVNSHHRSAAQYTECPRYDSVDHSYNSLTPTPSLTRSLPTPSLRNSVTNSLTHSIVVAHSFVNSFFVPSLRTHFVPPKNGVTNLSQKTLTKT